MTTTMTNQVIPGFSGEVEQFVAEHGITEAIYSIYEVTQRLFRQSKQVRVELYADHEDSSWVSVFFVIEGWPLNFAQTGSIDEAWFRETHPLIPPDWFWRIGHQIEWRE